MVVILLKADIGFAFDGDGDRLVVVTKSGKIITSDYLLMLFAKDFLIRNPGETIIFYVKCSSNLIHIIKKYGGNPVMWKTGHSLIKNKMQETGTLLAGEMSGHLFFKERWFGFDDGIYSAARLLEIISKEKNDIEYIFSSQFPYTNYTSDININLNEKNKFQIIEKLKKHGTWGKSNLIFIDGISAEFKEGWGLIRASNTFPILRLRFEANNEKNLKCIKKIFSRQLKLIDSTLFFNF